MGKKIVFGQDLIDVLENKYKLNRITEYPTKYKNGIVENNYFYGKVKTLDDLKYGKPYLYFVVDDETDGFISGELFLDGYEGIQFDSYDDIKYFMDNAKWTESKKSARKSLKEGIDVKIVYADDTPSEYIDDVTHNDILDIIEESPEVYKIFDVSGSKKKLVWSDEYGFERAYESKKSARKSLKESLNSDIKLMVNRIVDDLIGEYTSKEWDSLSANEKFDIIRIKYFTYEGKSKYLSEVRDLVIENMNHPFDIVFESNKSAKKSLKESVDGYIATDEDCNMSGKCWVLDGSYNFIMEFLQEWGIAPKDVKVKNGMTTLYNADGNPFGYVYQDEEVDIFVVDKTTNWTWENHNPSTKRVKVTALDKIF